MRAPQTIANLSSSQLVTDQFGAAIAVNGDSVVVGAPVEACVYIFSLPQLVFVPTAPAPNSTSAPPANATTAPLPTFSFPLVQNGQNIAIIVSLVVGLVVAAFFGPRPCPGPPARRGGGD